MEQLIYLILMFVLLQFLSFWFWRYFSQLKPLHFCVFLGIALHELSHLLACLLTFASVKEFSLSFNKGHVLHKKSPLPVVGGIIISFAPLFVGIFVLLLLFLFITKSRYQEAITILLPTAQHGFSFILANILEMLKRIDFYSWQFFLYVFIVINILATFTPSKQDYKNIIGAIIIYCLLSIVFNLSGINTILIYVLVFANIQLLLAIFLLSIFNFLRHII